MTKYKPVKIMFDLDDEYQLKLYEHLKKRTNGSSYMRTLIHQDMVEESPPPIYHYKDEVVKVQEDICDSEQPTEDDTVSPKEAVTSQAAHYDSQVKNEEEMYVEDLI